LFGGLIALGTALVVAAGLIGGRGAVVGGTVALAAQIWAVALLQPVMGAPTPAFMARWLGGMVVRVLALALVLVVAATNRATVPPLETSLGFLGVLLPLLFLETRFVK
jgi:hypothetical protein